MIPPSKFVVPTNIHILHGSQTIFDDKNIIGIHYLLISQHKVFTICCLAGVVVTRSPLTAATRVQYPASACEMVMWSLSQTGGFSPSTPVSSHTKTIRTQTSVPTSMINISLITCFVIV